MKRILLVTVVAGLLVTLFAVPATAQTTAPFPVTQGHFLTSSYYESWEVDASVVGSNYFAGFPWRVREPVHGLISVSSSRSDGSWVQTAFRVRPKYHVSLEYVSGEPDAGAAAGTAGYVVESSGEGAPAVGEFYVFYFFDGAQGLTQDDGTIRYYQDAWWFGKAADDAFWLRLFPRATINFFISKGVSHLPRVSEGDISIKNGEIVQ